MSQSITYPRPHDDVMLDVKVSMAEIARAKQGIDIMLVGRKALVAAGLLSAKTFIVDIRPSKLREEARETIAKQVAVELP